MYVIPRARQLNPFQCDTLLRIYQHPAHQTHEFRDPGWKTAFLFEKEKKHGGNPPAVPLVKLVGSFGAFCPALQVGEAIGSAMVTLGLRDDMERKHLGTAPHPPPPHGLFSLQTGDLFKKITRDVDSWFRAL